MAAEHRPPGIGFYPVPFFIEVAEIEVHETGRLYSAFSIRSITVCARDCATFDPIILADAIASFAIGSASLSLPSSFNTDASVILAITSGSVAPAVSLASAERRNTARTLPAYL